MTYVYVQMCCTDVMNVNTIVFKPIVIEGPRDTNERERLVMDRMITEKECSLLLELVTKVGIFSVCIQPE